MLHQRAIIVPKKDNQDRVPSTENSNSPSNVSNLYLSVLSPELVNPPCETQMVISLDQIDPYKRNPRRFENPRKEDIKTSIKNYGLVEPLSVTRIPGQKRYFIFKGGNTRLQCLKELWNETNDPRFLEVRCEFSPYEGDSAVLAAHLRGNELRERISFIDKALGLALLRKDWETEYAEQLSLRAFSRLLKKAGMPYALGYLSNLLYAARIYQYLWRALDSGIGRAQVAKLSKLENAAFKVWHSYNPADDHNDFLEKIYAPVLLTIDKTLTNNNKFIYQDIEDLLQLSLAAECDGSDEKLKLELKNEKDTSSDNNADLHNFDFNNSVQVNCWQEAKDLLLEIGERSQCARVSELPAILDEVPTIEDLMAIQAGLNQLIAERCQDGFRRAA